MCTYLPAVPALPTVHSMLRTVLHAVRVRAVLHALLHTVLPSLTLLPTLLPTFGMRKEKRYISRINLFDFSAENAVCVGVLS